MCAYNESIPDVKCAVESILKQTYKEFEFIIILDNPDSIQLDRLLSEYKELDSRIKYVKNNTNIGLANSLNKGLSLAKYEFVARMDADDISLENRLQVVVNNIDIDTEVYFSKYQIIDDKGNVLKVSERMPETNKQLIKVMRYKNIICHPTIVIKKESVVSAGGYSNLRVAEDFELWLRLIKLGTRFKGINEVLLQYRVRANSMTTSDYYKSFFATRYIIKYYENWNYLDSIDDHSFELAYGKEIINKKRFNNYAVKYNKLVNNWNSYGMAKYYKLIYLMVSEPRLIDLIGRTYKAKLLRKVN